MFALRCSKVSQASDCSTILILTSLVTWLSNSVVSFLIWLCLRVLKLSFLQDKACCTSFWAPQIHWVGSSYNDQLYLNFSKSENSCLFKQYHLSFKGNFDNHIDAPFSWCMSFNFSFSWDKKIVLHLTVAYFVEVCQIY